MYILINYYKTIIKILENNVQIIYIYMSKKTNKYIVYAY
jgi:hypothetical protein